MKKFKSNFILILLFCIGLSVLLYPTISDYVNQKHQSAAIAAYQEAVTDHSLEDNATYLAAAEEYNTKLAQNPGAFYDPDQIPGYDQLLDVSGMGIMGYITVDKLSIKLPIYHGTDATVLENGCGHLKGSSLPVGGPSTHSVLSAHRGLPSAKLFTDLDGLEEGDTFTVTVLDRGLTYEVDKISIVLPQETEALQIEEGKDYCTLMTCTPYGINSHRLLVRGHCVPGKGQDNTVVTSEAFRIEPMIVASVIAVPLLLVFLLWLLLHKSKRKGNVDEN